MDSDRFLMDDAEESVHKLGREAMSGSLIDATGYQLVVSLLLHDRNITAQLEAADATRHLHTLSQERHELRIDTVDILAK